MARSVDFHQHLWPERFVAELSARAKPPRLRESVLELVGGESWEVDLGAHDLVGRLALLDRDEIDAAVISLSPALGIHDLPDDESEALASAYEEGILELARSTRDRIVPLAVRRARDGFAGVSLAANVVIDLESVAELLDALAREQKLLFVHPGPATASPDRPRWWGEIVEYTAQMQAAYAVWIAEGVARWPELKVVFAILAGGWPFQLERLASRGVEARETLHENVYFETASYGRRALELCLATFGVRQLVYGSDVPVIDSKFTLDAVRGFGDPVADALCTENPARLLA
jgi:predicted TIM-barrel fold metal-dependent hydrolase